jgi:hypothetical protein
MKSNELSQSLTVEEDFFDAFKFLAIVGSAAGGLFCLYSYLNSGDTSSDKAPLNNKITNENKGQTFAQNPPKKSGTATFTSPDPNTINDGQLAIIDQQPGTTGATFYTTNNTTNITTNSTNISVVGGFFCNAATFVSDGLPKEHDGELKSLVAANFKTIQQLQQKVEELETRLAQQEKENHTLVETINVLKEASNKTALYTLKVDIEQCDIATDLLKLNGSILTDEDEKVHLKNIQNTTLEKAKELFNGCSVLSDIVGTINNEIAELSGQTSEHSDNTEVV